MCRFLIVMFVCCFAVPACRGAETAADYVNRGIKLALTGEYDKAIADFNQALAIDPKIASAYTARGNAWFDKGKLDKALADFNQALAIDPKDTLAYCNRGMLWESKGEFDKAIADYTKAQKLAPALSGTSFNLAGIYATCPDAKYRDGKRALEYAKKANQLSGGKDSVVLDILAAAYAESGDFAKAREWEEKAIELAPKEINKDYRDQLELYKQGKPYHEPPVKK